MNDVFGTRSLGRRSGGNIRTRYLTFVYGIFCVAILASPFGVRAQIQFTDVSATAGSFHTGESWGAAWGDVNGDRYPDIFASNHRPRSSIYRNNGDGTFVDVVLQLDTSQVLLVTPRDDHGAMWVDFDNDGDDDLMSQNGACCAPHLLVNQGGAGFLVDETSARNFRDDFGGQNSTWFDYNRDGLLDVMSHSFRTSRMMKQLANNTFQNVTGTDGSGACPGTQWSNLTDIDDDGDEELLCTKTTFPIQAFDVIPPPFTDITGDLASVTLVADSVAADFDGNLRPDVFVIRGRVSPSQAMRIGTRSVEAWLTTGDASTEKGFRFETTGDITVTVDTHTHTVSKIRVGSTGWQPNQFTFTLDPADTANHGIEPHAPTGVEADKGVYVGYFPGSGKWEIWLTPGTGTIQDYITVDSTATVLNNVVEFGFSVNDKAIEPALIMNNATGLQNQAASRGFAAKVLCNSAAAADYDNDGDVDLYLVCSDGVENLPNRLYVNDGSGNFTYVTTAFGGEGPVAAGVDANAGTGDVGITADFNVDGLIDIFVTNGMRMRPYKRGGPDKLFENSTSNNNDWILLDLEGNPAAGSSLDAIGAKVYVTTGATTQLREQNGGQHRWAQDHRVIHLGFGNLGPGNPLIDEVRVEWPSGNVDVFNDVEANRYYRVPEGGPALIAVTPGPLVELPALQPGEECGTPAFDPELDAAMFLSKNCATGVWQADIVAGNSPTNITTAGTITADGFTNVLDISLEANDKLDTNPDPTVLDFNVKTARLNVDSFQFEPTGVQACVDVTNPANAKVYVGPGHRQVSLPFDLNGLTTCGGGQPTLSINSVSVSEGANQANLTVSLSPTTTDTVTVNYATEDGTARVIDADYEAKQGTLTFTSNASQRTIQITILDDSNPEPTETFSVRLSNPSNAVIGNAVGTVTINDDDNGGTGTGRIGDYVWEDVNEDGIQTAGEPGMSGVTVELLDCGSSVLDSTLTNANGRYEFANLPIGSNKIRFTAPPGFSFTEPRQGATNKDSDANQSNGETVCLSMPDGKVRLGIDAGLIEDTQTGNARIGDFVWVDSDGDGRQDRGEPGRAGVTVNLLDCSTEAVLSTTATNANGIYTFNNLVAGTYKVEFIAPTNFGFSPQFVGPNSKDSNPVPNNGKTACLTMQENQNRRGIDAGLIAL